MASELILEKWSGQVSVVTIGATKDEGGTRSQVIKIGGEATLPFLYAEGAIPHKPAVAFEILDNAPDDPLLLAEKYVKEQKAQILCIRLLGAHPDSGNKTPQQEAEFVSKLLKKVSVPLIILGCGDDAKDNLILPACCEAARGERCLIGSAKQDNYKTIVAAVSADGHNIIAESPIDINIAKQLNILISDMGLPLERIVIDPTIGALGYGLEYAYSIMERARLAALSGDKTVASPFICFVGYEACRAKEAKAGSEEQAIAWEIITATALIQAGANLLVMRQPKAIEKVNKYIEELFRS
ncbi:MAG: acetyl-CoA decarbonylase/synthase complex subunit delta [Candidatus Omnitrophica bacterium]|nr:acetyl-CoA decarbonylase/synthase complex subunit delta [Candidatus Omnitrophota bacterium]